MYILLWEDPCGERKWEALKKNQIIGFLEKLLNGGVHPATVMFSFNPIIHWAWKEYHGGVSEVSMQNINEEICGTAPVKSKHEPVNVPERESRIVTKYGWIAPDGRYFKCDYGGHSNLADKIVGDIQKIYNPERHLEDLGWAKVLSGGSTRKRYAIGMGLDKKLTDAQLKTLKREGLEDSYGISFLL